MYPESRLGDAIDRLMTRRSVKAMDIIAPGPSEDELTQILQTAIRVPDHGKLGPWRFIRFAGDARAKFGDILAARYAAQNEEAREQSIAAERNRFTRAPVVIAVVACIKSDIKIPEWEQQLSAGAVCQNMLVATSLMGFAAQWLTEWYAFDSAVNEALGLTDGERIAGFVYIGSALEKPPERVRPDLEQVLSDWQAK